MHLQVDLVQPHDAAAGQLIREQIRELMETWQHRVVSEDEVDAELRHDRAERVRARRR